MASPPATFQGELFTRFEGNPILTADAWPYPCNTVLNPAAVRLPSGEVLLLARVEDHLGFSHLTAARSPDGLTGWEVDSEPTLRPDPDNHPEESWGIEDPRAVWVDELGLFVVTYTAFSDSGPLVAMAHTEDFRRFERQGVIMPPDDKNAMLFPRRIGGNWMLLHRPTSSSVGQRGNVWISWSPDLNFWRGPQPVLRARPGAWWDSFRLGAGAPPLETEEGWLLLYHGVRETVAGDVYRVGLALLDLEDPRRVIRRGSSWVLGPRASYERVGDVPNVVFPTGCVRNNDELYLYYGAADTCIGVARASLSDLLTWLRAHG